MFDPTYEVVLADTEASRAIHRKIRYHVYCLERQFENPAAFPLGEEHDPWDIHAAQFIVRHRSSGAWIAAMRLVLPEAARFPVETLQCLAPDHAHRPRRRELAEISRICVINSPEPQAINRHLDRNFGHVARNGESEVLLGMVRTIVIYGLERGLEHCYMLVTDAFARLLRRLGVVLHPAGTATDHRGLRTPYRVGLRENAKSLSARSAVIRDFFARKALAYQPFSVLDDAMDPMFEPVLLPPAARPRPFTPAPTLRSLPDPGAWRVAAERTRPGPGAWRVAAERTRPGSEAWRADITRPGPRLGTWPREAERTRPGSGAWRGTSPA